MATWSSDNVILTKLGEQVLSKVQAGIGKLTVSRIVSGSGHVSPSQLYNQTQVTDIKQELIIDRYSTTNSSSSISASLSNSGITEAYDLYQIGIYVTHPDFTDEILYLIAQCDSPDHIPVPEDTPVTLSYELVMAHSGTDNVTINVTGAGNVSVDTFNQFAEEINTTLNGKASSTDLDEHKNDNTMHVTTEEKEAWNGKANLSDIPTTLPANGGNADTIDGKHASDFIYARGILDSIDLDDIKYPCSALALNCINRPSEYWGTLLVYAGGTGSIVQLYIPTVPDGTPTAMYFRHYGGTGWTTWRNTADGGNADTLDGLHADEFYKIAPVQYGDANKCTKPGIYYCDSNAINNPVSHYGLLKVCAMNNNSTWIEQQFVSFEGAAGSYNGTWIRIYINSGWSNWVKINDGGMADAARETVSPNAKAKLWEDSEGGNLRLVSPDGHNYVEMDIFNNESFRMYFAHESDIIQALTYNFTTKKLNINGNAATVNGHTVNTNVPANAKFTDTTYGNASTSAPGLVSTGAQTFAGNKTFNGQVIPVGATDLSVAQARRIMASTTDLTAGSSPLTTGTIYLVYE